MILDLFICDNTNNIIYGNNIKYNNLLSNINIHNNKYNTYTPNGIISYLYVNDIIICILHNDDSFTASKLLLYVKKYIASCGLHINKESIIHNYFMYVTNLYNINYNIYKYMYKHNINNIESINNIHTDNIYIDVIEQYNIVIHNNKVIKNTVHGEVIYKDNREITVDLKIPSDINIINTKHNIKYKDYSNNTNLYNTDNHKYIQLYYKNGNNTLLTYYKNMLVSDNNITPIIYVNKNDNIYKITINSNINNTYNSNGIKFNKLKISIPIPYNSYDAIMQCKNGELRLNREKNMVEWRVANYVIKEETLYIEPLLVSTIDGSNTNLYNTDNINSNIMVNLQIENYNKTLLRIEKSEAIFNQIAKVWVKYYTQASNYEIRE